MAKIAVTQVIQVEPVFTQWVDEVLMTRNRIINKIKSQYWTTEYKFGIDLPNNIEDVFRLYEQNGNHFWRTSIEKETKTIRSSCQPYKKDEKNIPPEKYVLIGNTALLITRK